MTNQTKETVSEELPPFSFTKQPIKHLHDLLPTSAIPSKIERAMSPATRPVDHPTFNNINYDDKIRAPRMLLAVNYTYEPGLPLLFKDRKNLTEVTPGSGKISYLRGAKPYDPSQEDHLGNLLRAGHEEHRGLKTSQAEATEDYRPATADINQPTRRNLEPPKKRWGLATGNILLGGPFEEQGRDPTLSRNPSYGSSKSNRGSISSAAGSDDTPSHQKLLRAMENLSANTTLQERCADGVASNVCTAHGGRNRQYVSASGPAIQQVYTRKKPLLTPAVLRPALEVDGIYEEDLIHDLSPEVDSLATLNEFPFEVPTESAHAELQRCEPTHEHWKPDNSSDHCMNCFEGFRGFFTPLKRGRHHCRFCGLLYCMSCLYKPRDTLLFEIAAPVGSLTSGIAHSVDSALGATVTGGPRESRTGSGSSHTSSVVSSLSTTSSSTVNDEGIDGVMLDAQARMVIPLFRNLLEQGTGLTTLQEKFKVCKVCKTCGNNSLRLRYLLNQRTRNRNDISAPYVFIENPYMNSADLAQPQPISDAQSGQPWRLHLDKSTTQGPERRVSYSNVPSDWTWSSF